MSTVVDRILEFNQGRIDKLVQLKYKKMHADAFAFFRGTNHLFYQDWPATSSLNDAPVLWICGDLHLQNLGCYQGENRLVYFNINDFDEGVLAPCTWDLTRFVTSLLVAAPGVKVDEEEALTLGRFFLDVYSKEIIKGRIRLVDNDNAVGPAKDLILHVKQRTRQDFLKKRTERKGNTITLHVDDEHAIHIEDAEEYTEAEALIQNWGAQQPDPQFFKVLDLAQRIAGVGSLGVKRYMVLVEGKGSPDKNVILDLKAAHVSSLQPYLRVRQPEWTDQAERCTHIQQRLQGIAPDLLTPIAANGQSYVLRELQPLEDDVDPKQVKGKPHRLEQLVKMIAKVVAWGQLRGAGHRGAADADAMKQFVETAGWHKEVIQYARDYAQQVNQYYQEFASAYQDDAFK